jgi:N-acetylmuramoyl-L-alanine amidase
VRGTRTRAPWRRAGSCAAAALLYAVPAAAAPDTPVRERFDIVVIDAGHGGSDTGAKGPAGTLEKDVALTLARELAVRLRAQNLTVVMTRDADVFVPLEQRTALANDAQGDLFVSIHANAASDPRIHGSETYFLALEASDAAAAGVAERENQAFAVPGSPQSIGALSDPFIALLGDLISTEHLDESSSFARNVQKELATLLVKSRGVKQALFVVLTGVQMPAALVEVGFVTHPGDERLIGGPPGRAAIVAALENAVTAFGRRYDARRGQGGRLESRPTRSEPQASEGGPLHGQGGAAAPGEAPTDQP